jgi:hypothetical protein
MNRRCFLGVSVAASATALVSGPSAWAASVRSFARVAGVSAPRFGLVTYLWGRDLTLPDLLAACAAGGLDGVELRTTHAHGVEPSLDAAGRAEVRARFADSPVSLVGLGSDERFDSPDPARLAAAKAATIAFLRLSADVGGSGVKVKPDSFHDGVERSTTIAQIAASLAELGPIAADLGQELRLEVHGQCADPTIIRDIVRAADHPAVRVCWNSNRQDLRGLGFERHYDLLRPFFGGTMHVRELEADDYPFADLLERVDRDGYDGTVLLEAHTPPPGARVEAFRGQRAIFDRMTEPAAPVSQEREVRPITISPRAGGADTGYDILAGDERFATLRFGADERTPAIFPLYAPGDRLVLRSFPFARVDGETDDHPHHRGLWFAHGDVNGHDFWHDPACRIDVREHEVVGDDTIRLVADWVAPDGVAAVETRSMRFSATGTSRRLDLDFELRPTGEGVIGDTKEGTIALRLAPPLRVEGPRARGRLENADGRRDAECWGRRAAWILAEGPVAGRLVRVRMIDRPSPGDLPTYWHARNYGLLAANPFGRRAFEGAAVAENTVTVTSESPWTRRLTVLLEAGR